MPIDKKINAYRVMPIDNGISADVCITTDKGNGANVGMPVGIFLLEIFEYATQPFISFSYCIINVFSICFLHEYSLVTGEDAHSFLV